MNSKLIVTGAISALLALPVPCFGQETCRAEVLEASLNNSKILGPQYRFIVRIDNDVARVNTEMLPTSSDDDFKINAVLIAKKVMDICPKGITKVRVFYRDPQDPNLFVAALVREGDIKAFGSKLESKEELLSSIDLVRKLRPALQPIHVQTKSDITLALKILSGHITQLSSRGADVKALREEQDKVVQMRFQNASYNDMAKILINMQSQLADLDRLYPAPTTIQRHGLPSMIIRP